MHNHVSMWEIREHTIVCMTVPQVENHGTIRVGITKSDNVKKKKFGGKLIMLKIKKIKNKEIAKVMSQVDTQPCKYAGHQGAYDCLYDCTTSGKPRYYASKDL